MATHSFSVRVRRAYFVLLAVVFVPLQTWAGELSGTFVGGGADFAVILQLLPSGEGKVVGRLRTTSVDKKGSPRVFDRAITGAANADSFIGKIDGNWENGGTVAISGNLEGGLLRVSAANGLNVGLKQGDERVFNLLVEAVARQGLATQQQAASNESRQRTEEAENRTATQIASLRTEVIEFSKREPRTVEAQAIAAQRYTEISQKMKIKFASLQETAATADGTSKRSYLNADIYHLSIDAWHIHIDVQNAQSSFEQDARRMAQGLSEAHSVCQRVSGNARLSKECVLVPQSEKTFSEVNKGVKDSYVILESAWEKKRAEHEDLLRQSNEFKRKYDYR